jgi:hypothetical protein
VGEIPVVVEAELARLRAENARLLKLLRLTPQQAAPPVPGQAAFFEAPLAAKYSTGTSFHVALHGRNPLWDLYFCYGTQH